MDNRAIQIMNKIISEPLAIGEIYKYEQEYYFTYKGKAISILYGSTRGDKYGNYSLYVYPKWDGASLARLATEVNECELDEGYMITFHCAQFVDFDAEGIFASLYDIVRKKHLNLDSFFDAIMND